MIDWLPRRLGWPGGPALPQGGWSLTFGRAQPLGAPFPIES
jgi:hypothetical protein